MNEYDVDNTMIIKHVLRYLIRFDGLGHTPLFAFIYKVFGLKSCSLDHLP